jgi:hypothetical protein
MGLIVEILRGSYNSSRNVLRNVNELTLVNVDGPFEPTSSRPAARLEQGPLNTLRIVPEDISEFESLGAGFLSFGGTYAAGSDSRFHQKIVALGGKSHVAIAIHDFFETYEENARMD